MIALKGKLQDATINVKKGSDLVAIGLIIIGICKLNILLNLFINSDRWGTLFNVLLALLVGVPLIVIGVKRLTRAEKILTPKDEPDQSAIDTSIDTSSELFKQLPADTDRSVSVPSVTEHTTLELKEPEQIRR
jgi:hypothetical protein